MDHGAAQCLAPGAQLSSDQGRRAFARWPSDWIKGIGLTPTVGQLAPNDNFLPGNWGTLPPD
jgi:hypothetical protein